MPRFIQVGVPALVAVLLLWIGASSALAALQEYQAGIVVAVLQGLLPSAIGLGLLAIAVAVARRSRLGFAAALVAAVGFIGLAAWFIVSVIPHINEGPFNFVLPAIVLAAALALASGVYAVWLWRARGQFAALWQPLDKRVAGVLAGLLVATPVLGYGLNAVEMSNEQHQESSKADARALVAATTLAVHVFDLRIAPTPDGTATVVDGMTLGIDVQSPTPYGLVAAPTLCLTDEATFRHEAYKPGIICWGIPGPEESLRDALKTVPGDMTSFRIQLRAAGSPCAFEPGTWHAQLTLAPDTGAEPDGEVLAVDTTFEVSTAAATTGPAGDSTVEVGVDCLLVSP